MEYKETQDLLEENEEEADEGVLSTEIGGLEEEIDDTWREDLAFEETTKKVKPSPTRFSLKSRRAIEELIEQRRLREEISYFLEKESLEKIETNEGS